MDKRYFKCVYCITFYNKFVIAWLLNFILIYQSVIDKYDYIVKYSLPAVNLLTAINWSWTSMQWFIMSLL
jgi:hypothetical protein